MHANQTTCVTCETGKYSTASATGCASCPAGEITTDHIACHKCPNVSKISRKRKLKKNEKFEFSSHITDKIIDMWMKIINGQQT